MSRQELWMREDATSWHCSACLMAGGWASRQVRVYSWELDVESVLHIKRQPVG